VRKGGHTNLRKRLAELERKITFDPIELRMRDGRIETLRGYSGHELFDLFGRAIQEVNAGVELSPDVALIKNSVGGTERGGCMIEMIRALLSEPVSDRSD
jgi:hypothetical protein